jgi:DNA-binding MarR family transcriptional regulator
MDQDVDYVARALPQRLAVLTRLFFRVAAPGLPRTEAGVLNTLTEGPRRITELAELEGVAQPTMTLVVKRLEERGWVARDRHALDGRVVLVTLTEAGQAELEDIVEHFTHVLHDLLETLSDDEVQGLVAATDAVAPLITSLQGAGNVPRHPRERRRVA